MSTALLLSLAGLALLDSTSLGTLFIPVWLLISPGRVSVGKILTYLATLTVFYFGAGLLIVLGADSVVSAADHALDSRTALWVQLVLGVGLFVLSFRFDPKRRKNDDGTGRWRHRVENRSTAAWPIALALLAGLVEVATMLPYLGAIAMLTTSDLSTTTVTALLAGYCLLMVTPALLLLAGRTLARARIQPLLDRMNAWITKKAGSAMGWALALAGFLVARDAAARLWFPDRFGS